MKSHEYAEELADEMAGNEEKFESYARHLPRHEGHGVWAMVYTHNRDSGVVERSNARVIAAEMAKYPDDAHEIRAGHWACGWVEGYEIRTRTPDGTLTDAWIACASLRTSLADYPILNDEDFSREEADEADHAWSDMRDVDRLEILRDHWDEIDAERRYASFADLLRDVRDGSRGAPSTNGGFEYLSLVY